MEYLLMMEKFSLCGFIVVRSGKKTTFHLLECFCDNDDDHGACWFSSVSASPHCFLPTLDGLPAFSQAQLSNLVIPNRSDAFPLFPCIGSMSHYHLGKSPITRSPFTMSSQSYQIQAPDYLSLAKAYPNAVQGPLHQSVYTRMLPMV